MAASSEVIAVPGAEGAASLTPCFSNVILLHSHTGGVLGSCALLSHVWRRWTRD